VNGCQSVTNHIVCQCCTVDVGGLLSVTSLIWVVSCVAVLTWVVYCLSVNTDIQNTARQEVRQVCAEVGDVSSPDVDKMT